MFQVVLALAVAAGFGWLRPRWSSAWAAGLFPAALLFVWLLLHEDIPEDPIGLVDIAWYVGMSLVGGAPFGVACALGIAARRASGRQRAR